jgi:hypothetical protein
VCFFYFRQLFKTKTRPQTKTVCVQWGFCIAKHGGLFLSEERLALALDGLRSLRRQVE